MRGLATVRGVIVTERERPRHGRRLTHSWLAVTAVVASLAVAGWVGFLQWRAWSPTFEAVDLRAALVSAELVDTERAQARLDSLAGAAGRVQHLVGGSEPAGSRLVARVHLAPRSAVPAGATVHLLVTRHGSKRDGVSAVSAWSSTGEVVLGSSSALNDALREHRWLRDLEPEAGGVTAMIVPVGTGDVVFEALVPDSWGLRAADDLVVTVLAYGDHWSWAQRL